MAVSCEGLQHPMVTTATAMTLTGGPAADSDRCEIRGREVRSTGVSVAWPCSRSSAEDQVCAGYACGREPPVEERDVGGEERSRDQAGV